MEEHNSYNSRCINCTPSSSFCIEMCNWVHIILGRWMEMQKKNEYASASYNVTTKWWRTSHLYFFSCPQMVSFKKKNRKDGRHTESVRYIGSIVSVNDTTWYHHLQTARQMLLQLKHDPWHTRTGCGFGSGQKAEDIFPPLGLFLESLNFPVS